MAIKTRIQLKNDTEANWNKARNFVPLLGEVIIYRADEDHASPRLKVGDGTTYVVDLPFITANSNNNYVLQGTTAYWNSQRNFIPDDRVVVVYSDGGEIERNGETIEVPRIKIGDGNAYCIDLPFVSDDILSMVENHINDSTIHVTPEEKAFWSNKINTDNYLLEENLVFTRN